MSHFSRNLAFSALLAGAALAFSASALAEDRGPLRVGTESSYAPFEFTQDGKLVGFDIDLAEAVCQELGYQIEWVQMPFDGLIPAMLTSQVDMAVASFTVTEERAKRINFSDPYYRSGITFVIRAADADKYAAGADALKGKQLCAQLGSVSAMKAETLSPGMVTTFNDAYAGYLELKQGGCEAMVNDRPVNQYFIKTSKGAEGLLELAQVMDAEDMAMVIPKGNDELLAEVNKALAALKANGKYDELYTKWFGEAPKAK